MISDIDFLCGRPPDLPGQILYLYRAHSGLLKSEVRNRIEKLAKDKGAMFISPQPERLSVSLTASSLFSTILVCDLGDKRIPAFKNHDLEYCLDLIGQDALNNPAFLMVPDDHAVVKSQAWREAALKATYIEEPLVSAKNLERIISYLLSTTDLGDLSEPATQKTLRKSLVKFVGKRDRTILEIAKKIDRVVLTELTEIDKPADAPSDEPPRSRRLLSECLVAFLDRQSIASLKVFLVLLDELRFENMLSVPVLVGRIYFATAAILSGSDKRYKRNRSGSQVSEHLTWALLLLAWKRPLTEGGFTTSINRLCQTFMSVQDHQSWLSDNEHWREIATQLSLCCKGASGPMDRAHFVLAETLKIRVQSVEHTSGLGWLLEATHEIPTIDAGPAA